MDFSFKKIFLAGIIGILMLDASAQNAELNTSGRRSSRDRGETTDDRERRREDRTKARDTNSRSTRGSGRSSEATPAPSGSGGDPKTVEGKKPAATSGSGGGGGGERPALDIKFEMQVDPETNILYLESVGEQPSLNAIVYENKKFVTRLALYNPKTSEFSQIDASLRYDPQLIRPVGVDDGTIASNLAGPGRVLVDERGGLLSFAADFATSRSDSFLTVARIQWEALEPVASTPIRFLNTADHPSGVFNDQGQNILHPTSTRQPSSRTGLLDATVTIEPEEGTIELASASGNPFSAIALATNINSGTAEGGIELYLRPRRQSVSVGETFLVDILYRNPKRADMDTVKLKVRFDPDALEVVDADEGNWITRGINIFDAAYHESLPFDHHRKNQAHNNLGLIVYDKGFGSRTPVPSEGTIATIKFRAKAPVASTPVVFSTRNEGQDVRTESDTSISFLGFNLIGSPGNRAKAMNNTSISIR